MERPSAIGCAGMATVLAVAVLSTVHVIGQQPARMRDQQRRLNGRSTSGSYGRSLTTRRATRPLSLRNGKTARARAAAGTTPTRAICKVR
jgi:hypothetical protein